MKRFCRLRFALAVACFACATQGAAQSGFALHDNPTGLAQTYEARGTARIELEPETVRELVNDFESYIDKSLARLVQRNFVQDTQVVFSQIDARVNASRYEIDLRLQIKDRAEIFEKVEHLRLGLFVTMPQDGSQGLWGEDQVPRRSDFLVRLAGFSDETLEISLRPRDMPQKAYDRVANSDAASMGVGDRVEALEDLIWAFEMEQRSYMLNDIARVLGMHLAKGGHLTGRMIETVAGLPLHPVVTELSVDEKANHMHAFAVAFSKAAESEKTIGGTNSQTYRELALRYIRSAIPTTEQVETSLPESAQNALLLKLQLECRANELGLFDVDVCFRGFELIRLLDAKHEIGRNFLRPMILEFFTPLVTESKDIVGDGLPDPDFVDAIAEDGYLVQPWLDVWCVLERERKRPLALRTKHKNSHRNELKWLDGIKKTAVETYETQPPCKTAEQT